ncbi:MAG: hypothetical protein C5B56_04380, partial [Proteobacteria bacterium]
MLPAGIFSSALLEKVSNIEKGLKIRKQIGLAGSVGLIVSAAAEAAILVANEPLWQKLVRGQLRITAADWTLYTPPVAFFLFFFAWSWSRFWLNESKAPFRYTCSIQPLTCIDGTEQAAMRAVPYDLAELLARRLGRFSFIESSVKPEDETSHIHIQGAYLIREKADGRKVIEVMPAVRVGGDSKPHTLAHPVAFRLSAGCEPQAVSPADYAKLIERVYFSVATEIYQQIQQDVRRKIALLPAKRFRAVALLHEADDYARSNTLDAYEDARRMYRECAAILNPTLQPVPAAWSLRVTRTTHTALYSLGQHLRKFLYRILPGSAQSEILYAQAEMGWANMLLSRRMLAATSGRILNPVFAARHIAKRAIDRLESLPPDVPQRTERLFDAYVTMAFALYSVGAAGQPEAWLNRAAQLDARRSDTDAFYLLVKGQTTTHRGSALQFLRRAVEQRPRFELAQTFLAVATEYLWRSRGVMDSKFAGPVINEFDELLTINPGNITGWANKGYTRWLLGLNDQAESDFENGREYKTIARQTFVSEVHYGLARIAAERGDFERAYEHSTTAISALLGQGAIHVTYFDYYYALICPPYVERFERYVKNVAAHREASLAGNTIPRTVLDSVYAFALNDLGAAYLAFYRRSGDVRKLNAARSTLEQAIALDNSSVLPRANLTSLEKQVENYEKAVEHGRAVTDLQPTWLEGRLAEATLHAEWSPKARQRAETLRQQAKMKSAESETKAAEAARLRARSFLFDPEGAPRHRLAAERQDPEALAEQLEQQAKDAATESTRATGEAEELEKAAARSETRARSIPEELVPESWRNTILSGRKGPATQLSFLIETADEPRVRALCTLAWVLAIMGVNITDKEERRKTLADAQTLIESLEQAFWPEDWDLLRALRGILRSETVPSSDRLIECERRMRTILENALLDDPGAYLPLTWLGEMFVNHDDEAVKLLNIAIKAEILSPNSALLAGNWFQAHGYSKDAAGAYDRVTRSDDPDLLSSVGTAFQKLEKLDEGIQCYRQAIALAELQRSEPAGYFVKLATGLWAKGDTQAALAELDKVVGRQWLSSGLWRRDFVQAAVQSRRPAPEFALLRRWLLAQSRASSADSHEMENIQQALLELSGARVKNAEMIRGTADLAKTPLMLTPIAVEGHQAIFPEEQNWFPTHDLATKWTPAFREYIQKTYGLSVPGVRYRANPNLPQGGYRILFFEVEVNLGNVQAGMKFCADTEALVKKDAIVSLKELQHTGVWDPQTKTFNGAWLTAEQAEAAQRAGVTTLHHLEYIVLHLRTLV